MFVVFIQISAIGVFFINFLLRHIEFKELFGKKREKRADTGSPQPDLLPLAGPQSPPTGPAIPADGADEGPTPPSLTKALTYGIDPRGRQEGNVWTNENEDRRRDLEDIPIDGSRPHAAFLHQSRSFYKAYSMVVTSILVIFVIVYLRPDLFPFLDYSAVYKVVSRTFPDKYLDIFQKKQEASQSSAAPGKTQTHHTPPPRVQPAKSSPSRKTLHQTPAGPVASDYWYLIELKDGETILTQDAVITRDYVSVMYRNGEERRIKKIDLKNYARKKLN